MDAVAEVPESRVGKRFDAWLDRRIPPAQRITLNQANIFIFPTGFGFVFGGLLIILILGAINYQNSLVYGVAFLLGSMFIVTILYTFRNLSGLSIELAEAKTGFVGEDIEFNVRFTRPKGNGREGVQTGWPTGLKQWVEIFRRKPQWFAFTSSLVVGVGSIPSDCLSKRIIRWVCFALGPGST
jgi:hypothetical protein